MRLARLLTVLNNGSPFTKIRILSSVRAAQVVCPLIQSRLIDMHEISCECVTGDVCLFFAQQPQVGQGLLIHEASRSHSTTHHS
jgi:hypothetical protein